MAAAGVQIRPESLTDVAAIGRVTSAAFLAAPRTSHSEAFIVTALRQAGELTLSRVAIDDDEVVGHVAASSVAISGRHCGWYGLGPVAVLPSHQRRGIGSALVMDVLVALSSSGASGCVVLGDPQFYERFGFQPNEALVLPGAPPENFLAVAFDTTRVGGIVSYHDAFRARN